MAKAYAPKLQRWLECSNPVFLFSCYSNPGSWTA